MRKEGLLQQPHLMHQGIKLIKDLTLVPSSPTHFMYRTLVEL